MELQKNYGIAFFSLGNVHTDLKEYNDAMSCYQRAIEINPNIIGAHNNLGLVYLQQGQSSSAIKAFKAGIRTNQ